LVFLKEWLGKNTNVVFHHASATDRAVEEYFWEDTQRSGGGGGGGGGGRGCYRAKKLRSVNFTKWVLTCNSENANLWGFWFSSLKKQDDAADALLHALHHLDQEGGG